MTTIRIGTRKSKLAMWQTETVAEALHKEGIDTEISGMETKGDKILDTSIAKIGSKGVFTEELEEQLATGITDIAVHSAKDMQSNLPRGFELIAFTTREQVNDVLVSDLQDIDITQSSRPLTIGTSSVRRVALLKHFYPHLRTVDMRGNLQTRIAKMRAGDCDALLLAYAGVKRMGYEDMIVHVFPESIFIPPVGQGCIAVEAASSLSSEKREQVRRCVNDEESEACLLAERAFLHKMEGGCSIPSFGLATLKGSQLTLQGGLVSLDGQEIIKHRLRGPRDKAFDIGEKVGEYILENGGRELLARIRRMQEG
ncbi:hydroxymethylbilane synthase [Desulfopila inferna]|uniref:hydroxymethylbilane synthase n=1 Tax=Desulfopila inferna TaxID=468528 RepID=UPI001962CA73|nr:hydroxymethylbilane synthase [Desulfopila inferna]MBM9606373.1 hydroxymethylbilane synthase [Desulfopila inferna]